MKNERIKVTICTGTTCYILGGSNYLMLMDNLPDTVKNRVEIEGSPCMGYCRDKDRMKREPCLAIGGTTYHGLSLDEAVQKITETVEARDSGVESA